MSTTVPAATPIGLAPGRWALDARDSLLEFQVKHLGLAVTRGRFGDFEGTLEIGREGASARGSVAVTSLDTGDAQRDANLLAADFLDAEHYPRMEFVARAVRVLAGGACEIEGRLELHGAASIVTLHGRLLPGAPDASGPERVRLSGHTQLSRAAHHLRFAAAGGAADATVGDTVKIRLELALVKLD